MEFGVMLSCWKDEAHPYSDTDQRFAEVAVIANPLDTLTQDVVHRLGKLADQ
jgi:hypothetical protein